MLLIDRRMIQSTTPFSVTVVFRSSGIRTQGTNECQILAIYFPELKEQIAKKMMPSNSQTMADISQEPGISTPNLYAYEEAAPNPRIYSTKEASQGESMDVRAKLAAVVQTASMNETVRSTSCRDARSVRGAA